MPVVYKPKKCLLYRLKKPERITSVIPTAKLVRHQGEVLVAVPHRPDETQVLRNIGLEAPDSMPLYYDWPGPDTPFEKQRITANFLTMHRRAFCLNGMGTGKTRTAVWAFDYMKSTKTVHRALVISPLSVLDRAWADTVFCAFPHLNATVLYGSAARRKKLLARESDLYVINFEGLKSIIDDLKERPDIDLVIVDELARVRNASTDQWKNANIVINKQCPRRAWGLTGAPIPNEPTDAWAQCRLITPNNLDVPKYFRAFRESVMRQTGPYSWVEKEDALEVVRRAMQPSVRFSLDECTDTPPQLFETHHAEMSTEQKRMYNEMVKSLATEYAGGQIMAINEAVKTGKLLQIIAGVAYATDGENVVIPSEERISACVEAIEQAEGKALLFVPLTGALNKVAERIAAHGYKVAVVDGSVKKDARDAIFADFQSHNAYDVLVAHPKCMAHGLTLTAATVTIWYLPTDSDTYQQANARTRRTGQHRTTLVINLESSKLERKLFARLEKKQNTQGALLDLLESQELLSE